MKKKILKVLKNKYFLSSLLLIIVVASYFVFPFLYRVGFFSNSFSFVKDEVQEMEISEKIKENEDSYMNDNNDVVNTEENKEEEELDKIKKKGIFISKNDNKLFVELEDGDIKAYSYLNEEAYQIANTLRPDKEITIELIKDVGVWKFSSVVAGEAVVVDNQENTTNDLDKELNDESEQAIDDTNEDTSDDNEDSQSIDDFFEAQGVNNSDEDMEETGIVKEDDYSGPVFENPETVKYTMSGIGGGSNALLIIFKWGPGENVKIVPNSNEIVVSVEKPSGSLITKENIEKLGGSTWQAENSVFYAIPNSYKGNWNWVVTKEKLDKLGIISPVAEPIDGVAQIKSLSAKTVEGKIALVWDVIGIPDDNYNISFYLQKEGGEKVLVDSLSSFEDGIRKSANGVFSTSKFTPGKYDLIATAKNIDLTPDQAAISRITTKHDYIIKNVEIK